MKKTVLLLCVLSAIVLVFLALPQYAGSVSERQAQTVTYDVSCDGSTFVLNRVSPAATSIRRGDTFVLTGKIYPGNTIPEGGTRSEPSDFGPDRPGSIGVWIARGVYLASGSEFDSEKIQRATTHYFLFNGKSRIFTEGFEGSTQTNGIILGGLKDFAGARGTVTMSRIGVNATKAYNLRFVFEIE